jgi:hypothetical protein
MALAMGVDEKDVGLVVFLVERAGVIELLEGAGADLGGLEQARQLDDMAQRKAPGGVALHGPGDVGDTVLGVVIACGRLAQGLGRKDGDVDAPV